MAQFWSLFVVALVYVAYEGVFVDGACPSSQAEAEAEARKCLNKIGLQIDAAGAGESMANNDMSQMKQYCTDGTLDSALGCVEEIVNDCKAENEQLAQSLNNAISISRLRSGLKYMCDNIQLIIDNSECIGNQVGPISSCVELETKWFQAEMQAMQAKGQPDQDDIWRITCGFMDRIFGCQHKVFKENCGQEIADVMTNFMQSVKPPVCADYSGAVTVSVSWTLLAGLLSLLMYLRE